MFENAIKGWVLSTIAVINFVITYLHWTGIWVLPNPEAISNNTEAMISFSVSGILILTKKTKLDVVVEDFIIGMLKAIIDRFRGGGTASIVVICILLASCGRKSFPPKIDTVYFAVDDSGKANPIDDKAQAKSDDSIHTVFVEIAKECPTLEGKLPALENRVKDATTLQAKTGGAIRGRSKKFNADIELKFKDNESWFEIRGKLPIVVKTEKVYMSTFEQIVSTWFVWAPPWCLIIIILLLKLK